MKGYERQRKKPKEYSTSIIEKKLAILDKALTCNPLSEKLFLRKLDIVNELNNLDKVRNVS